MENEGGDNKAGNNLGQNKLNDVLFVFWQERDGKSGTAAKSR